MIRFNLFIPIKKLFRIQMSLIIKKLCTLTLSNLRTNGFFSWVGISQQRQEREQSLQLVGWGHREDGVRVRVILTEDMDHPHTGVVPRLWQRAPSHVTGMAVHLCTPQGLLHKSIEQITNNQTKKNFFLLFLYSYTAMCTSGRVSMSVNVV